MAGFDGPYRADASLQPLTIQTVFSAVCASPQPYTAPSKLRSTPQRAIFAVFLLRTTKPCWRKARRTSQKEPKRAAVGRSWFVPTTPKLLKQLVPCAVEHGFDFAFRKTGFFRDLLDRCHIPVAAQKHVLFVLLQRIDQSPQRPVQLPNLQLLFGIFARVQCFSQLVQDQRQLAAAAPEAVVFTQPI